MLLHDIQQKIRGVNFLSFWCKPGVNTVLYQSLNHFRKHKGLLSHIGIGAGFSKCIMSLPLTLLLYQIFGVFLLLFFFSFPWVCSGGTIPSIIFSIRSFL